MVILWIQMYAYIENILPLTQKHVKQHYLFESGKCKSSEFGCRYFCDIGLSVNSNKTDQYFNEGGANSL